jgi:hypothetical protein
MKQPLRLSSEEQHILRKLTTEQIAFLKTIKNDKNFATLKTIVDILIDTEKNLFFGENEGKYTPDTLYAKHAYARGGIGKITSFLRIIIASEQESLHREEERKKKKKKNEE